ncbi:hypothetical protein H1R20_g1004, partial [Candolleomyces eurysporus]
MLVAQNTEGYPGSHVHSSIDLQSTKGNSDSVPWIGICSDLVAGLLQLMKQQAHTELIQGGMEGEGSRPLYVARAVTVDGCFPGECGFNFPGARVPGVTNPVARYDVLSGNPGDYIWRAVTGAFDLSKIDDMSPVLGGHQSEDKEAMRLLYIARSMTVDGGVHLGYVSIGNCASIWYEECSFEAKNYEVLAHSKSNVNAVRALVGTYKTDGHWTRTKKAERYSTAIQFPKSYSWKTGPRIVLGLTTLDIGLTNNTPIRVEAFPQNITQGGFICNARSWQDGILHNAVVDWMAIEQPGWQCGVFKSEDAKLKDEHERSSEHRVTFAKPFEEGPPRVFACFSGLNISGKWNIRAYATDVDPSGFTIAIVSCGEEGSGPPVKLLSAAITWIAVPASDVTKKKNAWIGSFATGRKGGGWNASNGHVDFGFAFKRTPKIFLGLRQFSASNEKNLRLKVTTSKATTTGMDWSISKWHDTLLLSAAASFLAVDVD